MRIIITISVIIRRIILFKEIIMIILKITNINRNVNKKRVTTNNMSNNKNNTNNNKTKNSYDEKH